MEYVELQEIVSKSDETAISQSVSQEACKGQKGCAQSQEGCKEAGEKGRQEGVTQAFEKAPEGIGTQGSTSDADSEFYLYVLARLKNNFAVTGRPVKTRPPLSLS